MPLNDWFRPKAESQEINLPSEKVHLESIIIIAFSLISLPNQNKVDPRSVKASSIQYGYRRCGTHARVLIQTLARGNSKNEIK